MTARALPKHEPIESLIADLREGTCRVGGLVDRGIARGLFTVDDAAKVAGCSDHTMHRWIKATRRMSDYKEPNKVQRASLMAWMLQMAEREAAQ